jgi:hypothetical protein
LAREVESLATCAEFMRWENLIEWLRRRHP